MIPDKISEIFFLRHILALVYLLSALVMAGCHPASVTHALPAQDAIRTPVKIPFPSHKPFAGGTLQPSHLSQEEQDKLVCRTYDKWKKSYLLPLDTPNGTLKMYRVAAGKSRTSKTYSEGQGYGMMLAVYMAGYDRKAKDIFDGLWLFTRNNPSRIEARFMAYQVPVKRSSRDSAFDGDCDIALALLLADAQWGSRGRVNYHQEALTLTQALLERVIGQDSKLPMLGDWVQPDGSRYNQYSVRSSDIMPAHFKVFHESTGNKKWQEIVHQGQALVTYMQKMYSPETGLLPDFIIGSSGASPSHQPASGRYLESVYDGEYYYNASRVPWRIGFDALLNNDTVSLSQVKRMAQWVVRKSGGRPDDIGPGYRLNGRRLDNEKYLSKAFIAPFGVAAMVTENAQGFVNRVFDLCVTVDQDYFEDSIGLLCLLLITGNCWLPA